MGYNEKIITDSETIFEGIVLDQIKCITKLSSGDMHEGFYKYTIPVQGAKAQRSGYEQDGLSAYCYAVNTLEDLLKPKFTPEMTKSMASIKTKEEELSKDGKKISRENRYKISRRRFQKLNKFLSELGWLSGQTLTDV